MRQVEYNYRILRLLLVAVCVIGIIAVLAYHPPFGIAIAIIVALSIKIGLLLNYRPDQ